MPFFLTHWMILPLFACGCGQAIDRVSSSFGHFRLELKKS